MRDGAGEEMIVCALLHDVGESLGPLNHGEVVAAILRPFISEANHWMLAHHPLFQTYFYARHLGLDPNAREHYRDNPHYQLTVDFTTNWDEVSFDPGLPERADRDVRTDGPARARPLLDPAARQATGPPGTFSVRWPVDSAASLARRTCPIMSARGWFCETLSARVESDAHRNPLDEGTLRFTTVGGRGSTWVRFRSAPIEIAVPCVGSAELRLPRQLRIYATTPRQATCQ